MEPGLVHEVSCRKDFPGAHPHVLIVRGRFWHVVKHALRFRFMTLADPDLYHFEDVRGFGGLRDVAVEPATVPDNLEKLLALRKPGGSALVLGTGPSATDLDSARYAADVRIICNSTVVNTALLDRVKPNIVCFLDPVFHFGPSRYAAAFRRDCIRLAERFDVLLVVPRFAASLLLEHHPQIAQRVVALDHTARTWTWPRPGSPVVRLTSNVLTRFMLPVAMAVADRVWVAGCDGRAPKEGYFWKHNPAVQYEDDLMETVFAAHPGFFRDRSYAGQYRQHCRDLEGLILAGERSGKQVISITQSMIPALASRRAAD